MRIEKLVTNRREHANRRIAIRAELQPFGKTMC